LAGSRWQKLTYADTDIGVAITAAPSIQDLIDYYNAPGLFYGASSEFANYGGYIQFLDFYTGPDGFNYRGNCDYSTGQRYDYDDGTYRGKYDYFYNCGGQGGYDAYVLSAVSKENQVHISSSSLCRYSRREAALIVEHFSKLLWLVDNRFDR
jgi:hypothetical protein